FSLTCGLLVSTFGREQRGVMLASLGLLLFLTFGLPAVWQVSTWLSSRQFLDLLLLPSPAYAFEMVTDSAIRGASRVYWASMATIAALGALALVLSCLFLPRVFEEKSRWQQSRALEQVHRSWRYGHAQFRRAFAERFLDQWPFLWLLSRDRL